jgi:hypothetical protein
MFSWRYVDGSGSDAGTSESFAGRDEAETWLGDAWRELLERGVHEVELIDVNQNVALYRMSLAPDSS